jgi:hypothetical protein
VGEPKLELADIFRRYGETWRMANANHISLQQQRVMKAIEVCRTAALGGHVERCQDCTHTRISYNSCRNRHCPKCQWSTAAAWLAAREAELLPVQHFHVVFTLPTTVEAMAYQNKDKIYGLLFRAASKSLLALAANRLGAEIGITSVLHTWGRNLQHHPHLHCIVPGGGVALDGKRWICGKPGLLQPEVLGRSFRRLFLSGLTAAFAAGELRFFGDLFELNDAQTFFRMLESLHMTKWIVYSKQALAGPRRVLGYLARYVQRVAIVNSRLLDLGDTHVTFARNDHRANGAHENSVMRLEIAEFVRRFLLHVLPNGFRRVRHYGLLANGHRAIKLALCRSLLRVGSEHQGRDLPGPKKLICSRYEPPECPCCGGHMKITEILQRPFSRQHHVRRLDAL